jgi:hypothetical protein
MQPGNQRVGFLFCRIPIFREHYMLPYIEISCPHLVPRPDESYMGTLNLQFREYPIDDDEKVETYCRESDAFEQYVIEFINSHWDEHHPLKELNPNHHYMSNSYGDTIQVHFNDESLFIIITMTGQY